VLSLSSSDDHDPKVFHREMKMGITLQLEGRQRACPGDESHRGRKVVELKDVATLGVSFLALIASTVSLIISYFRSSARSSARQFRQAISILKGSDDLARYQKGFTYNMWAGCETNVASAPTRAAELSESAREEFGGISNPLVRSNALAQLGAASPPPPPPPSSSLASELLPQSASG
jgi:hypothetical protein